MLPSRQIRRKSYKEPTARSALDRRFAAESDPTRRAILRRLGEGKATVQDLAPLAPTRHSLGRRHPDFRGAPGNGLARLH